MIGQITFIELISRIESGSDEYGAPVVTESKRRIFATCGGVKRAEFYQAAAVGLKPEITFTIYEKYYKGERYVEHEGKRYRLLRSYPLSDERLELICTADIEGGGENGAV